MTNKITIFPCSGVGTVLGTISRQVAYKVIETFPNDTLLLCLPALVRLVQEDLEMLLYPVIVIEGCNKKCANYVLKRFRRPRIIHTFNICDFIKQNKIIVKNENRGELQDEEKRVVDIVAKQVVQIIKKIAGGKRGEEPCLCREKGEV